MKTRFSLLLLILVAAMMLVRRQLGELRQAGPLESAPLGQIFSPREQVAASLLGGFRALLINALWVRITWHVENERFLELPLYYQAVEELQGASPLLFQLEADHMTLDIPHILAGEREKRWQWISRGLEVLQKGLARFPGNLALLNKAGTIYYSRFHPYRCRADRNRFLSDLALNPKGEDPLDIAIRYFAEAQASPRHSLVEDRVLYQALILKLDFIFSEHLSGVSMPGIKKRAQDLDERCRSLVSHMALNHGLEKEASFAQEIEKMEKQLDFARDGIEKLPPE
ncbi:MAG: hypothetical protein HY717_15735 [Planctomycetes bacterium]|nr:hypothetical protein [Planctomycetota bacterium]